MKSLNLRSLYFLLFCLMGLSAHAQDDSAALSEAAITLMLDSVDASIPYQKGKVAIKDIGQLEIPAAYKFIPADKANWIVTELWGNPKKDNIMGMIVADNYKVSDMDGWAFVVSYDESGYVKDEDADDIDYAEMLKSMQESEAEENKERKAAGYDAVHIVDWAVAPFYDKDRKILHWAKKIRFGEQVQGEDLTLNYDVRILGRKGVLSLNAVGTMSQLEDINKHIPDVLSIAKFTDGNKYSDFNPSVDKIAAYTIGGLIAGKLIAKTGLLILLIKNIKLILIAMMGGFGVFRKKIAGLFNRKKNDSPDMAATPAVIESETPPAPEENTEHNS